jgi:hypothetical protein
VAMVLLRRGANIECPADYRLQTPLHLAVRVRQLGLVEALLSEGADIRAVDLGGRTALHLASLSHDLDLVAALLKRGAEVNMRDYGGMFPLHLALRRSGLWSIGRDKEGTVLALLEGGSEVVARDNEGLTALQLVMSYHSNYGVEKVLIAAELERFRSLAVSPGDTSKALEFESAANNPNDRVPLLSLLLSLHPGDYVYPRLMGDELFRKARISEAMKWYQIAIELDPRNGVGSPLDETDHPGVLCCGYTCYELGSRRIRGIRRICMECDNSNTLSNVCNSCYLARPQTLVVLPFGLIHDHRHEKFLKVPGDDWNPSEIE